MSFSKLQITLKLLVVLVVIPILFSTLANPVQAQVKMSGIRTDDFDDSQFVVRTMMTLSYAGIRQSYSFGMVDENGFSYDVLTLLNPQVVTELGLTVTQVEDIYAIKGETYGELSKLVPLAAVNGKEALEERFNAAENEIKSMLSEAQLSQLEQVKHQAAFRQVGLAKHLASSHFENGMSDGEAEKLDKVAEDFAKLSKSRAADLLKAANKKLLDHLTPEQQQTYEKEFESEFANSFLGSKMFTQSYSAKKKYAKRKVDLYRILKVKNVRTSIGLSDDQYAPIQEMEREERDQVTEKLTSKQVMKLNAKVISADLKRMGTVNSVGCGHFRNVIKIDDEQAEELYALGQEIHADLMKQLKEMKKEAFWEAMGPLSDSTKETIEKAIGDLTIAFPEKE